MLKKYSQLLRGKWLLCALVSIILAGCATGGQMTGTNEDQENDNPNRPGIYGSH